MKGYAAVFAGLVLLFCSANRTHASTVLFESGAPTLDSMRCDAEGCLDSTEWTVIDTLIAPVAWSITGFTFRSGDSNNFGVGEYLSTTWSIWSGDPFVNTPMLSGTGIATITPIGVDWYDFSIDGQAIDLPAGTYRLGYHHDFAVEAPFSALVIDNGGTFLQTDGIGNDFVHTGLGDLSFQVRGSIVPVPAAGWLFISCLGLLASSIRGQYAKFA